MNKLNTLFYYFTKFINNDKLIHADINKNNCLICNKYETNLNHNMITYYGDTHKYIKNEKIYECYKNNIKIKADLEKFILFIH